MDIVLKRSWAEIDMHQLERNLNIYKESLNGSQRIMAVVKADAYGHGDCQVARRLSLLGVTDFAVASLDEACKLRDAGVKGEILILGYTPPEYASVVYAKDLIQTVISEEYAEAICETNVPFRCNFALDTGMGRIGLLTNEDDGCNETIKKYSSKLQVEGVFTHLCVADGNDEESKRFTKRQIAQFENVLEKMPELKYNHCLNSAGGLWYDSKNADIVRLGIVLYGLKPDYENVIPEGIVPILQWKSVVSMVKWVESGTSIGYGRSFVTKRRTKIATISTGYADGYNRLLSNKGFVLINGQKAFIRGRVCMDQFMVDVTDIENVSMGTEVVLIGKSGDLVYTADDMAHDIGTIGYEVVCNISKRVPRVYI